MTAPAPAAALAPRKSLEPWIKDEVDYYPHQIEGCRFLWKLRSFICADDMGLGKSIEALTVFTMDVVKGWSNTALVVCPVGLKNNWRDEIVKFSRYPYIKLDGTPKERTEQLIEFSGIQGPKILIVNYEQVKPHLAQLNALHFDVAIFDEAHYLKNKSSQRTKACHGLKRNRTFLLTGTPMLNQVNELWSLLHMVDPKRWPDKSYFQFTSRYCVFGGYKDKQIVGTKNQAELTEMLKSYMLRRLKKDVLDLPDVQYIQRRVDLHDEQRKIYDGIIEDMQVTMVSDPDPMDIENALTKFLRLKQVCGTTQSFTSEDISSKLDLAVEEAATMVGNGDRIIVFTQFRDVLACYVNRMRKLGIPVWALHGDVKSDLRQGIVAEWSKSKTPGVIVCMLQVAGVGLNMTAGRIQQFVDKLFVPGLNQQAVDRSHRIGADKTQPVQVFEYIARKTIENRVEQILNGKKKTIQNVVEDDIDWKKKLIAAVLEGDDDDDD